MRWRPTVCAPKLPDQPPRVPLDADYVIVPEGEHKGLYVHDLPADDFQAQRVMEIVVGSCRARDIPLIACAVDDPRWTFALGLVIVGLGERKFI